MNPHASRALQVETEFLAGAENNLTQAQGRQLRGSIWEWRRHDEGTALRAALMARQRFDRDLLGQLPQNRRVELHGAIRKWWLLRRPTGVAIASVLAPPGPYLDEAESPPPPIGLTELTEHVRRIAPEPDVPHVIGVCSPSGFTDEVRRSHLELPNVTLVLVEPRADGGWQVTGVSEAADERVRRLFDPDTTAKKIKRVREEIDARGADLLTGGLSAQAIGERLGLSTEVVAAAFRQASLVDPELQTGREGADVILYRGAPVSSSEDQDMSMVDRLRQLFGISGNEAKKINMLSERRASLARRRDRLYEDIAKLEQREQDLLAQGRQNTSPVVRRRVASQLAQHRREMNRLNATASMLNQQINVLSTHIHNLTLLQQGQMARLPEPEELTNDAVRAEEMLEQLKADADLVATLDASTNESLVGADELAILKEFEQSDAPTPPEREAPRPAAEPDRTAESSKRREPGTPEAG